uniref:Uncharacterized protein n=1 Tax=Nelumbo nucifera TaxID=4432 RepID=A0A822Z913_NELNU|nr:TPA_asm: hypothetical protein HUJ06_008659 [Nelumbo nucifera]
MEAAESCMAGLFEGGEAPLSLSLSLSLYFSNI